MNGEDLALYANLSLIISHTKFHVNDDDNDYDDDGEDDSGFMIYTTKRPINSGHFYNFPLLGYVRHRNFIVKSICI